MSDWNMRRGTNREELYYGDRCVVVFPKDDPLYHKLFVAADTHDELLEACKLGLREAESWIHDQLDGTRMCDNALIELEPIRIAIKRAEGRA